MHEVGTLKQETTVLSIHAINTIGINVTSLRQLTASSDNLQLPISLCCAVPYKVCWYSTAAKGLSHQEPSIHHLFGFQAVNHIWE